MTFPRPRKRLSVEDAEAYRRVRRAMARLLRGVADGAALTKSGSSLAGIGSTVLGSAATQDGTSFASASHNHDGTYATADHNHDGTYAVSADIPGIVMVQCFGTSTAVIENTTADVTWNGTAVVADSAVAFSGADITFNTAGTYQVWVSVRSTGTQRMQTIVQGYLDTGSGYVSQTDWLSDNYNSRDSDQNDGVTHLNVTLVASAGDKIKFDAHANADSADSSAVLATAGTNVMILGKT